MIVGLVSTFEEGRLATEAVASLLPACRSVVVFDGPIGDAARSGYASDWTELRKSGRVIVREGSWASDAEKRTAMLEHTRRYPAPVWGLILDGDELLLHGESIPSWIEFYENAAADAGREPLRCPLRLTDGDGTVSVMTGRILRLDLVESWLFSSYEIMLRNGVPVALGNGKLRAVGQPDSEERDVSTGLQLRRPLPGEPSIVHRAHLRAPGRLAARQSEHERDRFAQLAQGETADERVEIWLPT